MLLEKRIGYSIALNCARLAPIFVIPEVEFESGFNVFGRVLSGDVHLSPNVGKLRETVYAKRDAFFPLDYTGLALRKFGVHFRQTGSGIRVRFYDAEFRLGRR